MKIRFHLLPMALLAAFVLALTAVTIVFSVSRLKDLAGESATTVFSLIAQRNADQLHALVAGAGAMVDAQAVLEPERILADGHVNRAVLVPALAAALRANPHIYSVYYGFDGGEFLQVIGVRGDARVEQRLQAPAGTYFAVRLIDPAVDGDGRAEHWMFLAFNEKVLGRAVREGRYLPSSRPWYDSARATPGLHVTDPYVYESLDGLGLTLSRALPGGSGVFGADLALGDLEAYAAASLEGRDGGIVVTDDRGRVLAAHASQEFEASALRPLQPALESSNPLFAEAAEMARRDGARVATVRGSEFAYASRSVAITPAASLHVVAFAPLSLYTGPIDSTRNGLVLAGLAMLALFLPLTYIVARRISGSLESLAADAERIQRLDFSGDRTVHSIFHEIDLLGSAQHTMKAAIRERAQALDRARVNLESLLASGTQLASRRSREMVLEQTLDNARRLAGAQAGQFWLCSHQGSLRLAGGSCDAGLRVSGGEHEIPLAEDSRDPCAWAMGNRKPLRIVGPDHGCDLAVQRRLLGSDPASMLAVPVFARGEKPVGVLTLVRTVAGADEDTAFDPGMVRYAETLAAQSGLALENIELVESQRVLMDSMLQLIAGAIDAKSAYTGAHCARVPELARMLAEAACEVRQGPLAGFRFETEDQWREFRIGTWLHDCGKVTTPEYVVDKATKLEIIFNRIHEIRTRFEVLLRDAEIARLGALLAGGDPAAAQADFDRERARLIDDFEFVARCNIGGESMPPEHIERLHRIGERTWLRNFDDRIGVSYAEQDRLEGWPREPLPATERLLADKAEHIVPRTEADRYDERFGFRMEVPEHLYNYGELYNLCIARGTLTPEERYKINEHIVQTLVMLEQLPLPDELKRVPEYAGTHHETLVGTGYPRRLKGEQLSIPARIMAIADIFEALTASDRPYKRAKPLSEAVRILASLKARGHIDPDLFDLFLTSGVYRRYAEAYLAPDQIDRVDVGSYLGSMEAGGTIPVPAWSTQAMPARAQTPPATAAATGQ